MANQALIEQIRIRRQASGASKKKVKKTPMWLYPGAPDRKYHAAMYSLVAELRRLITQILTPQIPDLIAEATYTYPEDEAPRNDNFIDDLDGILEEIRLYIQPKENETKETATQVGVEIAIFNEKQYEKMVNSVLGVDVFSQEPWLVTQMQLFSSQNAELITSLVDTELNRVSGIVQRGLQDGSSYKDIENEIKKSFGITRRHARLIARDQTTKLNGSLTKLRQQELGITQYRWQTSGDERVRESHKVLEDKICRWDDPSVYLDEKSGKWKKKSGIGGANSHPSEDVNCRCVPIAIIEGVFDAT